MANTLAYYDMATIAAVKSFIVQALGVIPTLHFLRNLQMGSMCSSVSPWLAGLFSLVCRNPGYFVPFVSYEENELL